MQRNRRFKAAGGFTLIELLIVVAVIAILAAIAAVNMQLAMVRAKTSRALADMATVRTALESYAVDHHHYPPDVVGYTAFILTHPLTTPVAYVSNSRTLEDPFNEYEPQVGEWWMRTYRYVNVRGRLAGMKALGSDRNPNTWLGIPATQFRAARDVYGEFLLSSQRIKYKENFARDEMGRVKAAAKWHEFYQANGEGRTRILDLKKEPRVSQRFVWSGTGPKPSGVGDTWEDDDE